MGFQRAKAFIFPKLLFNIDFFIDLIEMLHMHSWKALQIFFVRPQASYALFS